MMKKTIKRLYVQLLATVDQGKQIELLEASDNGEVIDGGLEVARIFSDNNEVQWFETYIDQTRVRIVLSELIKALQDAKATVRSEQYYEQQTGKVDQVNGLGHR